MQKISLSIEKHLYPSIKNVLEEFDENDRFGSRFKVTRTNIKDTELLQPEEHQPLQVPSVAARLIGYKKNRNALFIGKHQNDVPPF